MKKKNWNIFIAIERKQIYVSLFLGLVNPFQLSNKYHDYSLSSITDDSYDSVQFSEVYLS